MEEFGLTEAELHFGLSQADLLKFRNWPEPGRFEIGLAQADLDRLFSYEYPSERTFMAQLQARAASA